MHELLINFSMQFQAYVIYFNIMVTKTKKKSFEIVRHS